MADIGGETRTPVYLLQQAATESTPNYCQHAPTKVAADKRRGKSRQHRTHTPADRRKCNQLRNKLKAAHKEVKNEEFENHISGLTKQDNSIWKPIKSKSEPNTAMSTVGPYSLPTGPWARSDQEKADLLARHISETSSLHSDDSHEGMGQELTLPVLVEEQPRKFTLQTRN
jgi:hypothetical protein